MKDLIRLEDIVVRSQDYEVLSHIGLSLPAGKSTIIMGPAGCGKSTLLKVAAGITVPDSGTVYLEDRDLFKLSPKRMLEFRNRNGFVFQDAALWANKSIFENLALPLQLHRREMSKQELSLRINGLLSEMDLDDSPLLRPAQLSSGERKLVSFLRATILNPMILYLDEPTQSIDQIMLEKVMQKVREFKEKGCTIIAVTHDAHLTSMIADHLVVMKAGRILEADTLERVRKSTNREVISILSQVLSEAATYDGDILDLLGG